MKKNILKELLWLVILVFSSLLLYNILFGTSVFVHEKFVMSFHDYYINLTSETIATSLFVTLSFVVYGIRIIINRCSLLWTNCIFLFFCTILIVKLIEIPEPFWIVLSGSIADYDGWTVYPPTNQTVQEGITPKPSPIYGIIKAIRILQISLVVIWLIVVWKSLTIMKSLKTKIN